jgi:hypothetical protein
MLLHSTVMDIAEGDIADLSYLVEVTGLNRSTLSQWVRRGKLPTLDTGRVRYGVLFSWGQVRPILAGLAAGLTEKAVDEWPT